MSAMDTGFDVHLNLDDAASGEQPIAVPDTVTFKNPFFTFTDGVTFERRDGDEDPVMVVPMSEQSISMHFPGVIRELRLKREDHDFIMLDTVAKSLDYVCALRMGDPIPSEIVNGQASWRILDKHRVTARQRLTMQLVSWLSGSEELVTDPAELTAAMNNPEIKQKVDDAFASVAEALGYRADQKEEVVSLVETFADELAYIEALREVFNEVRAIKATVKDLIDASKFDETSRDSAQSVYRLLQKAVQSYAQEFLQIDAQTGEIIAVLKNAKSQILFIRKVRDELACRLLAWQDLEKKWRTLDRKNRRRIEEVTMETYRFLALRFLPAVNWKLVTQSLDENANNSESVW